MATEITASHKDFADRLRGAHVLETEEEVPTSYRRVYVWELPVRVFHWVNAVAVLALILTGLLIGNPLRIFYAAEPSSQYWFGWVRFIHFASGYVFFFNFLYRMYWAFAGNKYANWRNFIPYKKEDWKGVWVVLTTDIFPFRKERHLSVGHNPLASLTYFILFLLILLQSMTGFALYADMSGSFIPSLFAWVKPMLGGDASTRLWHHIFMWLFVLFTIIHVYLVFFHDWLEGRGVTSSIIGGWKFRKDEDLL
ncbi:MAG: Ni/Fe-hydrogenase, b-type cytochrome subunit [Pyrinomonadaceae bacterium]